jgi:hypothetical protein
MPYELTRYRGIAVGDGRARMFKTFVEYCLETIDSRPIGAGLLRSIANDGPYSQYKVVIFDARVSGTPTRTEPFDEHRYNVRSIGSGARIYWHPFAAWRSDRMMQLPGFLVLAHELIHARRMLLGIEDANDWISEIQTIGLIVVGGGDWIDPNDRRGFGSITENDIRAEHGLPLRRGWVGNGISVEGGQPIQPEERSWLDV